MKYIFTITFLSLVSVLRVQGQPDKAQSDTSLKYSDVIDRITMVPTSYGMANDGELRFYLKPAYADKKFEITFAFNLPSIAETKAMKVSGNPLIVKELGYDTYHITGLRSSDGLVDIKKDTIALVFSAAKMLVPSGSTALAFQNKEYDKVPEPEGPTRIAFMKQVAENIENEAMGKKDPAEIRPPFNTAKDNGDTDFNKDHENAVGIALQENFTARTSNTCGALTTDRWYRSSHLVAPNYGGAGTLSYLYSNCTWSAAYGIVCGYTPNNGNTAQAGAIYDPHYWWSPYLLTQENTRSLTANNQGLSLAQIRQAAYAYATYGLSTLNINGHLSILTEDIVHNLWSNLNVPNPQTIFYTPVAQLNFVKANYRELTIDPVLTVTNVTGSALVGNNIVFRITSNADSIRLPAPGGGFLYNVCDPTTATIRFVNGVNWLSIKGAEGTLRSTDICVTNFSPGQGTFQFTIEKGIPTNDLWIFWPRGDRPAQFHFRINSSPQPLTATVTGSWLSCPAASIAGPSATCLGTAITLTAIGGSTYQWNTGATTQSISINPSISTTYSVIINNGPACMSILTRSIVVVNPPNAGNNGSTTVCATSTATIDLTSLITGEQSGGTWTRTSGTGGLFNAAAGTFVPTGATTSSFTYTVAGTAPCGNATSTATVNINPVAQINTASTACNSGVATFNITVNTTNATSVTAGAYTVTGGPNTWTVQNIPGGTNVTIVANNASGCSSSQSVTGPSCTVICTAASPVSPDVSRCGNGSVTLTATAGVNTNEIRWYLQPAGVTILATGSTYTTPVLSPGTANYYVAGYNTISNCESDRTHVTVTINSAPLLNLNMTNLCLRTPVTITASVQNGTGTPPFTYQFDTAGVVLQNATANSVTFTPGRLTGLTVTVTDNKGCTDIKSIPVNSNPTLTITNNTSICSGQSTMVTADNGGIQGYTYRWLDNNTTNPVRMVSPTITTNYPVERTTAQGCKDTATSIVEVFNSPLISAVAKTDASCAGSDGTITVTASGNTVLEYSLNGTSWQGSNVFTGLAAGTYNVLVRNKNLLCSSIVSTPVTITTLNTISSGINGPTARCAQENLLFQADPAVDGATYSWTATGNATITGGTSSPTLNVLWSTPGAYSVSLKITNDDCVKTYSAVVNVTPAVFANAGPDKSICQGSSAYIGLPPGQAGPTTANYSWTPQAFMLTSPFAAQVSVNPPFDMVYTLTVTDPVNGCTRSSQVMVHVNVALNPVADAGADRTLCSSGGGVATTTLGGSGTSLNNDPNATVNYFWQGIDGAPVSYLSAGNIAAPVFTLPANVATGTVYKYVLNVYKTYLPGSPYAGQFCPAADTVSITVSECAAPSSIGDFVWNDINRNGIQDAGEKGIQGVTVTLVAPGGATSTTTTNADGAYLFTNLDPGTYKISFSAPPGYSSSPSDAGSDDTKDSDPVNGIVNVVLSAGQTNLTVDAGFYKPINLSGNVWHDVNAMEDNLVNNSGAVKVPPADQIPTGLRVYLVNASTGLIERVTLVNAATGTYTFTNITPATNYYIYISSVSVNIGSLPPATILPSNWQHTGQKLGTTTGNDGVNDGRLGVPVQYNDVINANFGIRKQEGEVVTG